MNPKREIRRGKLVAGAMFGKVSLAPPAGAATSDAVATQLRIVPETPDG